jgi:hypothetical protein
MSIYLFEFLFIMNSIYFQIGKIIFCSKRKKTNVKFWRLSLMILTKIIVRSSLLCFQMFFSVAMRNVATGGDKQVLCIIEGVQNVDVNVSDKEGSKGSKGEDNSQALNVSEIHALTPLVDNGRPCYVRREKRCTRPSIVRSKAPKKKAKQNNSLSQTQDIEAEPSNVNLQVDEDLLASLNSSCAWTSITSSIDVVLKAKGDGQEKEHIGEAL